VLALRLLHLLLAGQDSRVALSELRRAALREALRLGELAGACLEILMDLGRNGLCGGELILEG
jgi:hypothetical protein